MKRNNNNPPYIEKYYSGYLIGFKGQALLSCLHCPRVALSGDGLPVILRGVHKPNTAHRGVIPGKYPERPASYSFIGVA